MHDEGAPYPSKSAILQELVKNTFGMGHCQAVEIEFQLDRDMAALQFRQQTLLNPGAGEQQKLAGFYLGFRQSNGHGRSAELGWLLDRMGGRAMPEGFGSIRFYPLHVGHGFAK